MLIPRPEVAFPWGSESTSKTLPLVLYASDAERLTAVVVFPTPPFWFANAIILPYFLEEYGKKAYKKLGKLSKIAGIAAEEDNNKTASTKFIDWIKNLNKEMDIPTKIPQIKTEDIPSLAKKADAEANPLYPVPVLMNAKELEKIYIKLQK